MKSRIREVRLDAKLSMKAFADIIGVSDSTIALMESGKRSITDRTVRDICREFNINEEWLRNGTLPKMQDDAGSRFGKLMATLDLSEYEADMNVKEMLADLIEVYFSLDKEKKEVLAEVIRRFGDKKKAD